MMPNNSKTDLQSLDGTPTPEEILKVLSGINDPEVGLNLVDLGLIYRVEVHDAIVYVDFTVTNSMCPLSQLIYDAILTAVKHMPGVKDCVCQLVGNPPWNPSMISERGQKQLGYC